MSVEGATYMSVSFFSLKPLEFFYPPYVKGGLQASWLTIQILVQPLSQLSEKPLSIVCKTKTYLRRGSILP